jgi:hypothetical protein
MRAQCRVGNGHLVDSLLEEIARKKAAKAAQPKPQRNAVVRRAVSTTRKPCTGCKKPKVGRPSRMRQAMTAAAAIAQFVGDGMKTTTPEEQSDRKMICSECPLNNNGRCDGCGCFVDLKIPMRLQDCPAKKWHAELHPVRPIVDPICNLIMHILPVASNDVWRWNLQQIAQRQHLFNGKRVLAIATDDRVKSGKKDVRTVTADEVLKFSESIGLTWTHTKEFINNHTLREVVTFPWLLETVCSGNPDELTFSCHAKGVTHSQDSITVRWAERQYRACLDDWQTVWRTLERYSMAGSFRKFGQFGTPKNNRWHYSGTNYWFRHDDVFSRDWRTLDQKFFGTESWPGRLFKPEECACLFADDAGDVYKEAYWASIQREIEVWEGARNET